ncbi:Chloroperoxidase [Mycena haematopus]|nr:Chloroperoxidase [Mycena haematopus]
MALLVFSLVLTAVAFASASAEDSATAGSSHRWIAPTATDVPSPCPGLNTLANHGYLSRNGKNLTIPMMLQAAIGGEVRSAVGDAPTTLNLDALKLHNLIEHDASISRDDLLHARECQPKVNYYNATSAGQVQHDRLAISLATNPNITNTPKEFLLRTRESALYLSIMGNPLTGVAPKEFVQIFFREERLPIEEGWKRSDTTITAETMNDMEGIIIDNSNWTPTQLCDDLVLGPTLTI